MSFIQRLTGALFLTLNLFILAPQSGASEKCKGTVYIQGYGIEQIRPISMKYVSSCEKVIESAMSSACYLKAGHGTASDGGTAQLKLIGNYSVGNKSGKVYGKCTAGKWFVEGVTFGSGDASHIGERTYLHSERYSTKVACTNTLNELKSKTGRTDLRCRRWVAYNISGRKSPKLSGALYFYDGIPTNF